jgi:hypothetical protein
MAEGVEARNRGKLGAFALIAGTRHVLAPEIGQRP